VIKECWPRPRILKQRTRLMAERLRKAAELWLMSAGRPRDMGRGGWTRSRPRPYGKISSHGWFRRDTWSRTPECGTLPIVLFCNGRAKKKSCGSWLVRTDSGHIAFGAASRS